MPTHVFTYGSLMFPEIWQRVVRGAYRCAPALLARHARYEIANETYPGMVERPGSQVDGMLYFDVDAPDLGALDAFEGADYRRATVQVQLEDGSSVAADTYIYLPEQNLSDSPWRPESFQMARFIGSYCREKLGE